MSKFYSAIHILAVLFLSGINNCDVLGLTYWDANRLQYPLTVSALPFEPTEPRTVRGQKCKIEDLGFTCCAGVKPGDEQSYDIIPTCVKFVKNNEDAWKLQFIMSNQASRERYLLVLDESQEQCQIYPRVRGGVELCVTFGPLKGAKIDIHFKTTAEKLDYKLYFDTLDISSLNPHAIEPKSDAHGLTYWDANRLQYPLTVSALPWEPTEPRTVRGQKCKIEDGILSCCAGVKPGPESWRYIVPTCVTFSKANKDAWRLQFVMTDQGTPFRYLNVLDESQEQCQIYPRSRGSVELCVAFSPLNGQNIDIHFKTTAEKLDYKLYFDTIDISSFNPPAIEPKSDALGLTFWNFYPFGRSVRSELPCESTEPRTVKGQECYVSSVDFGFFCCAGVKPGDKQDIILTCAMFIKERERERWSVMFNVEGVSSPRYLQGAMLDRSQDQCRDNPFHQNVGLCVVFGPLNGPKIDIYFQITSEGVNYKLNFDTFDLRVFNRRATEAKKPTITRDI